MQSVNTYYLKNSKYYDLLIMFDLLFSKIVVYTIVSAHSQLVSKSLGVSTL